MSRHSVEHYLPVESQPGAAASVGEIQHLSWLIDRLAGLRCAAPARQKAMAQLARLLSAPGFRNEPALGGRKAF